METSSPLALHQALLRKPSPKFSFQPDTGDFFAWRQEAGDKLLELLGLPLDRVSDHPRAPALIRV